VDVNLFVNRLLAVMQPIMFLILNLTSVAIIWIGASRIDSGSLQIGDMLAFMQYAMQAIFAFLMISIVFIMAPRAFVSANRVVEILETDISIKDPVQPTAPPADQIGTLVFENVTFAYPGADSPAIQDISFTAIAGQTTALIGSTGSGKSTLLNLIPRFYDVNSGRILIDGVDVREMNLDDLYARIGYVPQKTMLFSGTVASNLRYGSPDSSDLEMKRSARIAQADDFIEALADRYEHPVAQGGGNVSGGQKQRLSIARAIARNPQIYLFDDSFSSLDFKTESLLRTALRDVTRESIVIVVAQRVSAIMHADNIIVLEAGRVVGQGTHQSLLKTNAIYQEIAASQLSAQELAEGVSPTPGVPEDLA
jgi:ATP-binding cassette subfamily B protein